VKPRLKYTAKKTKMVDEPREMQMIENVFIFDSILKSTSKKKNLDNNQNHSQTTTQISLTSLMFLLNNRDQC